MRLSWRDEEEEWGGGSGRGRRRNYSCCTFVPGQDTGRYKCAYICTRRSHQPVQMWGICTGWVGSGPDEPLWEEICTSWWMAPTGTNAIICTGGQNTRYKQKSGLGYMCDSLVVLKNNDFLTSFYLSTINTLLCSLQSNFSILLLLLTNLFRWKDFFL
jgi:hypothetical protein